MVKYFIKYHSNDNICSVSTLSIYSLKQFASIFYEIRNPVTLIFDSSMSICPKERDLILCDPIYLVSVGYRRWPHKEKQELETCSMAWT